MDHRIYGFYWTLWHAAVPFIQVYTQIDTDTRADKQAGKKFPRPHSYLSSCTRLSSSSIHINVGFIQWTKTSRVATELVRLPFVYL